jgi:hypothetical protein
MKIVRLLVGESPLSGFCAIGCWFGRIVGRRRVSDAVSVGRRAELETFLYAAKAGRMVRAVHSEGARRLLRRARRNIVVDMLFIDIMLNKAKCSDSW